MKKILAILLAILMAFSVCTFAFAEGDVEPVEEEYNWVLLPTSPEGLAAGAFWLDWDGYKAALIAMAEAAGEELTQADLEELNAEINGYKSMQVYFDADKMAVKILAPVVDPETHNPVLDPETNEPVYETIEEAEYILYYVAMGEMDILRQVGAEWVLVKPADAELKDGDFYFDKAAAVAAYRKGMEDYYKSMKQEGMTDEEWFAAVAGSLDAAVASFEESYLGVIQELYANKAESELFQYKAALKIPETEEQPKLDDNQQPVLDPETQQPVMEVVPVLDPETNEPVFLEMTITYPLYTKVMYSNMELGEDAPEDAASIVTLPYESVKAGIKQYKAEEETKEDDGGYSNNGFMKFFKMIVDFFKGIFEKIAGIFKK